MARTTEFVILVPSDLVDHNKKTDEEILKELGQQAITEACEEADDWVMPATWTAEHTGGDIHESFEIQFLVKRTSH